MPYVAKRSLNAQGAFAVSEVQLLSHNRHGWLRGAIPFAREPAVIQVCLSFSAECAFSLGTACYAPAVP